MMKPIDTNVQIVQSSADIVGVAKMMTEQIEYQRAKFVDIEFMLGENKVSVVEHEIFVAGEKIELPIAPTVENFANLQTVHSLILEIAQRQPEAVRF